MRWSAMLPRSLITAFFVAVVFQGDVIESKNSYLALVPKTIRPGLPATVNVNVFRRTTKKIFLTAGLLNDKNETIVTSRKVIVTPGYEELPLQIPKNLPKGNYIIRVEGRCTASVMFVNSTKVTFNSKSTINFIQTDKGIYKPGQIVHIRALSVHPDLKVVCQRKDIVITDSKNNRIKQWLNQTPKSCVFEGTLKLTEYTNLGDWAIEYTEMGQTEKRTFTVEEYVLPKYEVKVILPSYTVTSLKFFTGKVTAKYTFDKPLKGQVLLRITTSLGTPVEKKFSIDGEALFRIPMSEVTRPHGGFVTVNATVTEDASGNKRHDAESIRIYQHREKLRFTQSLPRVFKPNLPYTALLRVTQQDDTLLHNPTGQINITISYHIKLSPKEIKAPDSRRIGVPINFFQTKEIILQSKLYDVPSNGILKFKSKIPKLAVRASVTASYKKAWAHLFLQRAQSPSDSYILLELKTNKPKVGQKTWFRVRSTRLFMRIVYQVSSKGNIVQQGVIKSKRKQRSKRFFLRLSAEAAPRAQVLVYYVRRNGEVVTDSVTFSIDGVFRNKVSIKFKPKKQEPGKRVALQLRADPKSMVYINVVDKSVLLLKSGNDITQQEVLTGLQGFDNVFSSWRGWWWWWFPIPTSGIDAFSVFQNAGLIALTDMLIYHHTASSRDIKMLPMRRTNAFGGSGGEVAPIRVRKFFPETWLFTKRRTNKRGRAVIRDNVPDTLTTWVASAFAVNSRSGLGVAPSNANLTVFQSFFIVVNLPYSAIRGEVLFLHVNVFNYLGSDKLVTVTLKIGRFSFCDANGNIFLIPPGSSGWSQPVFVRDGEVGSVYFPIIPTDVGSIEINVEARYDVAGDAVKRTLEVEAEGIPQRYSIPTFIDLRSGGSFSASATITFPSGFVPDSEHIQISAIGDVMGSTINGIENLLRMSYGCGEQNLVNFVPNVFVTKYLDITGRLTEALKNKAIGFLEQGYQRELRYKHSDGSYSAFGERDKSGSTWLTAFVVKSFAQAKDRIDIDPNVMTQAIKWLLKQQQPSGEIKEPGVVLHKAMQGGSSSSKKSLTAFVLIALQEAKDNGFVTSELQSEVNNAITKAANYISADISAGSELLMYELAITTYALRITGHPLAETALAELEKIATIKDGKKYWIVPDDQLASIQPYRSWRPPVTRNKAVDVEVTAYALLVYAYKKDLMNGLSVIKWLSTQRNERGGFISTQDTVIAIQALAEMAAFLYDGNFDITSTVRATGSGSAGFQHTFTVNKENALVLQIVEAPKTVRNLEISATGRGICFIETTVFFNIERELRVPSFHLNYTISNESMDGFRLDVCFSWVRSGSCGMSLLQIGIPTGMEVDLATIDTTKVPEHRRSELKPRKVELYLDKVTHEVSCVGVKLGRVNRVARQKPVPITIFDYYEPTNEKTLFYNSALLNSATVAQVCGSECSNIKMPVPTATGSSDDTNSSSGGETKSSSGETKSSSGGETKSSFQGDTKKPVNSYASYSYSRLP